MSHPMIEHRRDYLRELIAEAETTVAELELAQHDAGYERQCRLGNAIAAANRTIYKAECELRYLDMEAADPAAHGYVPAPV